MEEVRGDDPELAGYLRIEDRELEAGGPELIVPQPLATRLTSALSTCLSPLAQRAGSCKALQAARTVASATPSPSVR